MFKSSILTITSICLAGILYGQEKKDLALPAFLAPATVVRSSTPPAGPSPNAESIQTDAESIQAEIAAGSTRQLEIRDPESGATRTLQTTKTIRTVEGNKSEQQPNHSAGKSKPMAN